MSLHETERKCLIYPLSLKTIRVIGELSSGLHQNHRTEPFKLEMLEGFSKQLIPIDEPIRNLGFSEILRINSCYIQHIHDNHAVYVIPATPRICQPIPSLLVDGLNHRPTATQSLLVERDFVVSRAHGQNIAAQRPAHAPCHSVEIECRRSPITSSGILARGRPNLDSLIL